MKTCSKCKVAKPAKEFWKMKSSKDGLQYQCKECIKTRFQQNKAKVRVVNKIMKRQRRQQQTLQVVIYLQSHGCVDCGEKDPRVLDFDHIKGKKINGISTMISNGCSMITIMDEIAKCEVRCANCHRRRTAIENEHYSYIDFDTLTLLPERDKDYIPYCINCGEIVSGYRNYCDQCLLLRRHHKIQWPEVGTIIDMIQQYGYSKTAEQLGLKTGSSVKKHLAARGVDVSSVKKLKIKK